VYVIAYPALTGTQQISKTGGRTPVWSARSGELFFLKSDTVMATSVSTQRTFDWTTPRPLFARPDLATHSIMGSPCRATGVGFCTRPKSRRIASGDPRRPELVRGAEGQGRSVIVLP
jgi:hypothetical protein